MPLLDCYAIEIAAGTQTVPVRTTSHAVCAVMEGSGTSRIGEDTISWEPRDVFSLPDGNWTSHQADGGVARLFVCTDREILRRLDLLSEEYQAP
jgi:gentisate 1,2-dioxygenase